MRWRMEAVMGNGVLVEAAWIERNRYCVTTRVTGKVWLIAGGPLLDAVT